MKFEWLKNDQGGFTAKVGDVSLHAVPDRLAKGFTPKPARGAKWRAFVSHWDEKTRSSTRYGRDAYFELQNNAESAMRLAEEIFNGV